MSGTQLTPNRKGRRNRRVLLTLCALPLLAVLLLNGCAGWLARSIVWGPNTDRNVDPAADAQAETLARLGVDRALRVDAGPPAASLSLWVVEPQGIDGGVPRGTVLVLHGINDKKESMLGVGKHLAGHGYRAVLVDLRAHGR